MKVDAVFPQLSATTGSNFALDTTATCEMYTNETETEKKLPMDTPDGGSCQQGAVFCSHGRFEVVKLCLMAYGAVRKALMGGMATCT